MSTISIVHTQLVKESLDHPVIARKIPDHFDVVEMTFIFKEPCYFLGLIKSCLQEDKTA